MTQLLIYEDVFKYHNNKWNLIETTMHPSTINPVINLTKHSFWIRIYPENIKMTKLVVWQELSNHGQDSHRMWWSRHGQQDFIRRNCFRQIPIHFGQCNVDIKVYSIYDHLWISIKLICNTAIKRKEKDQRKFTVALSSCSWIIKDGQNSYIFQSNWLEVLQQRRDRHYPVCHQAGPFEVSPSHMF